MDQEEAGLDCPRCHALLLAEEMMDEDIHELIPQLRCPHCAFLDDPVRAYNRALAHHPRDRKMHPSYRRDSIGKIFVKLRY